MTFQNKPFIYELNIPCFQILLVKYLPLVLKLQEIDNPLPIFLLHCEERARSSSRHLGVFSGVASGAVVFTSRTRAHDRGTSENQLPRFRFAKSKMAATRSNATTRRIIKTKKKKKNGRDCSQPICLQNVSRIDFRLDGSTARQTNRSIRVESSRIVDIFYPPSRLVDSSRIVDIFYPPSRPAYRVLNKCLSNRLPVRRVDCKANESIDSSRIESNRRHFLPCLKAGLPCIEQVSIQSTSG